MGSGKIEMLGLFRVEMSKRGHEAGIQSNGMEKGNQLLLFTLSQHKDKGALCETDSLHTTQNNLWNSPPQDIQAQSRGGFKRGSESQM